MSVSTIILNQNNIVNLNNGNNKLVFQFPSSVRLSNHAVAISNVSMFYSWYNISDTLGNNTFQYTWSDNGGTVDYTFTVTLPNGTYNISDINAFLQSEMINNGTYAIDASGNYVYFLEMIVNNVEYAVQLNSFTVPTVAPSVGWTYQFPTAGSPLPTTSFNPQFIIPSAFNKIIGYTPNYTFPSTITSGVNESDISSQAPEVQPNPTLFLTMTGIQNPYTIPSSIIYSITPDANVGDQIVFTPPQLIFNKIIEGTYDRFSFAWLGSDLNPITINDPSMTITLEIRNTNQDLGALANMIASGAKG
jgi:hypothetical protein